MLKLFYKTFLISVMSFSLMTFNIIALAEEAGQNTNTVNSNSATSQMSQSVNSNGMTRNSNGVLTKTETHHFEGTGNDGPLSVITMLAVGVIGTKLLTYKKWTLDMTVIVAASVLYITAEIANIMNLKSQLKDMDIEVTKNSDGKVDQTQIETLEKLKTSYQKVQKSAKTRKMLQMGAAAAFGGAVAIAAYERLNNEGMLRSCQAAITQAEAELTACVTNQTALASNPLAPNPAAAAEAAACEACGAQVNFFKAGIISEDAMSKKMPEASINLANTVIPEEAKLKIQSAGVCGGLEAGAIRNKTIPGACSTYLESKARDQSYTKFAIKPITSFNNSPNSSLEKILFAGTPFSQMNNADLSSDPLSHLRSSLQRAVDLIFPKAEAGIVAMLGLGAGAAAAFFGAQTAAGQAIDEVIFTPGGRMIAWGVMTGAAVLAATQTQAEIDRIGDHISQIDQILKDLYTLKSGVKSNNVREQQIKLASLKPMQETDLQLNPNASFRTDCIIGVGNSACNPSLSNTVKSMPGFSTLPDSFKTIASQSAKAGDGLSGTNTISASTLTTAGSLAGQFNAIAKANENLKNKINDGLVKAGNPKIDFEKQEKNLWNHLKEGTNKALQSSGLSSGTFVASVGLTPIPSNPIVSKPVFKPTFKPTTTAAAVPLEKKNEFNLNLKESPNMAEVSSGSGSRSTPKEKFDIGANDINTNSGDSIFQMISNRYFKSGYPKLLDEIPVKK